MKHFKSDIVRIVDNKDNEIIVKNNNKKLHDIINVDDKYYAVVGIGFYTNRINVRPTKFNLNPELLYHRDYVFKCPYCRHATMYTHNYDENRKLYEFKYVCKDGIKFCTICKSKSMINKVAVNIQLPIIDSFDSNLTRLSFRLNKYQNRIVIQNQIVPLKRCSITKLELVKINKS